MPFIKDCSIISALLQQSREDENKFLDSVRRFEIK